jgi:hypothetical protein
MEDMMGRRKGLIGALLVAALGITALMLPGIAAAKDRNHDRIPDRWEKRHGLSLRVNQAHRDQDRDKLVNRQEFKAGDDPRDADSDNDGTPDGQEDAGTIASFDGTTLTITLFHGQMVSGLVTDSTEIKCDNGDDQGDEDEDGTGGDDDSNSGPGGGGDDKAAAHTSAKDGGTDDDPGDDDPGDDDNGDNDNGDQGDDGHMCSTADLVPGAVVQEASIELSHGDAVFEEIELSTSAGGNTN